MKKIMRNTSILLTIVGALVFFASCKKYLDKQPSNNYSVISTVADVQGVLDAGRVMNYQSPSLGDAVADDYYVTNAVYNALSARVQGDYIWYDEGTEVEWQRLYRNINLASLCLQSLNDIGRRSVDATAWDYAKGSALVYRGSYHLRAAWNYAKSYDQSTAESDLGVVLRTVADMNIKSVRSNLKDSYAQILKDLHEAIPLLPNIVTYPLRPSKGAAYGFLARAYLSMRDYEKALLYADSCLQINDQLLDYNTDISIPAPTVAVTPFSAFNKEVIFSSGITVYSVSSLSTNNAIIDSALYRSYGEHDLRGRAFFRTMADGPHMRGNYMPAASQLFTGITTAEMILVRAECLARIGQIPRALQDLNYLLEHRISSAHFNPIVMTDRDEVLDLILEERRKELVMRDLRWMDVKRLNKEDRNISISRNVNGSVITLKPNDNRFARPIPVFIINQTGMPQNPQ